MLRARNLLALTTELQPVKYIKQQISTSANIFLNQTGEGMISGQLVPSPCSDLSTNKSLNLTIGYKGDLY